MRWGAKPMWSLGPHHPCPLQEQRSAVFVILFALVTILILYSSNSANELFHHGSLRGLSRRPTNLKKWSITDGYVPILGNKVGQPLWGAAWWLILSIALHHCSLCLFSPLSPSLLKERVAPGVKALAPSAFSSLFAV